MQTMFAALYDDVEVEENDDKNAQSTVDTAHSKFDKKLKDFFSQKGTGGKLNLFAGKQDGITSALLAAKNLSNPVDVSGATILRAAKNVLKNCRKALAAAKSNDSDYKNGSLPSGRNISDYQRYIRECMFVQLQGKSDASSGKTADDDYDREKNIFKVKHRPETLSRFQSVLRPGALKRARD